MRQITVNIYQYDELPTEAAKQRARDWMREALDVDADYYVRETIENTVLAAAEGLGFTVQRDARGRDFRVEYAADWSAAAFWGDWRAERYRPSAVITEFPTAMGLASLDATLADIAATHPSAYAELRPSGHSRIPRQLADAYGAGPGGNRRLELACEAFADWVGEVIAAELRYLQSDEHAEETIQANEYEFLESGDRA